MTWSFTSGSTQRHTHAGTVSLGATATSSLMVCWCYPTALSVEKTIMGAGTLFSLATAAVDSSKALMYFDNTTDGEWETPAGVLANDRWTFLAVLTTQLNSGSTEAVRLWAGYAGEPPIEQTMTNTVASSGNFSGSATLTVGNASGSFAFGFGGDIGWAFWLAQSAINAASPLPIATAGTITDAERDLVYQRWVYPLWAGRPPMGNFNLAVNNVQAHFYDGAVIPMIHRLINGAVVANPVTAVTVTGAPTFSQREPPSRLPSDWLVRLRRGVVRGVI